jgi:mannose-6-phosphate isomerase-like protein (cupin superfamily)
MPEPPFRRHRLNASGVFASDGAIHMETRSLPPGASSPLTRHPRSDAVMLFYSGRGEVLVADRAHRFEAIRHSHVAAGVTYQLCNTGQSALQYVFALCPPGPAETPAAPMPKAAPGGATLLSSEQYDRFPDSGLVRGGMWFLDAGATARYHSHDGAPEVFVFLKGRCEMTVEGEKSEVAAGDVVHVAPEMKHGFFNPGPDRLAAWLTVTPNVTPSHTFYEQLPDSTWKRVTPRLDGRPIRPPTR